MNTSLWVFFIIQFLFMFFVLRKNIFFHFERLASEDKKKNRFKIVILHICYILSFGLPAYFVTPETFSSSLDKLVLFDYKIWVFAVASVSAFAFYYGFDKKKLSSKS